MGHVHPPDDPWTGLLDDAAIFPPGEADLDRAVADHLARQRHRELVSSFVITDTRLPELRALVPEGTSLPVSIVVSSGAGGIAGALRLAAKAPVTVAGLEIALRDPDDLAGNARRVDAAVQDARDNELLPIATTVYVELPQQPTSAGWLAAADEVAAADHRLKFRTGGVEAHLFPEAATVADWIDSALDRELPFKCTAGLHHAVRYRDKETGFEHHGFLNVMLATLSLFDGDGQIEAARILDDQYTNDLVAMARDSELTRARRWFTGFGTCSVDEPIDDLVSLGLLEESA